VYLSAVSMEHACHAGGTAAMSGAPAAGRVRTFSADVTASITARAGFEAFRQEWEAQTGRAWPLAGLDVAASTDFRISAQSVHIDDVVISDVYSASYVGRTTAGREADDRVLIHLLRQGSWRFAPSHGRGRDVTVPAGAFIVRHDGPPTLFDVASGTTAEVLILPASASGPLSGGSQQIVGSARSAEVRVLMAHAHMVTETAADLTPQGAGRARDALLELARAVVRRDFDDVEPRLAPALARAAREIADARLTDPGLSPASLARQLNISVRTLHRAFAAAGESAGGYIRRRRLEQARLDLAAPLPRPGIAEVAARWQFADSSHFIRAFKSQFGQTPAEFARANAASRHGTPVTRPDTR
jgi:AraC family transcriptional regulator, positive regulator of tynA and feaB